MKAFRFASDHELNAPAQRVFTVLQDVDRWDQWWPQIREIRRLSSESGMIRVRSALPIDLRIQVTAQRDDPDAGILRAGLDGDLVGWTEFTVQPLGPGCVVRYRQECQVAWGGPRRALAIGPGRLVLRWNHRVMIRDGMLGLARAARPQG